MKVQKGWSCFVFIVLHMTCVAWTQIFQVVGPSSTVLVHAGEDVILPTSLSPAISAQRFEVRWFRDDFDFPVLLYQNLKIRPERQMQAYKGRTALFLEELQNGNVSLRLQDVRVSDGGLYTCFVDSGPWNEEFHISLKVEVLGGQPSISINSTEDQQTKLYCTANKWGTIPDVTWRDMNGVDMTSESNVTEDRDNERFLRVSSFIPIKQEFNVFSCLMRSKAPKPDWHSVLTVYGVPSWLVVFWLSLFLYLAVADLLIFQWRRMRAMKVQNGWSCSVFFLLYMTHVTWTQNFDIIGPSTDMFALLGEDVTLPASLSPPLNAQPFEVMWVQKDLQSLVLLYQNFQIRNEYQLPAFKGRTALFPEELMSGNVSLRLQDVHVSDGGLYRCLVASGQWNEETHITLNVEVVGTQPSISISTAEDQQTRLECSSEKWSSRPEVTWRDMNGIDVTSQSTLTVQRDDEGLLRVSSVIPIKWEFNVFSCLMRSNTTRPAYLSKMGVYAFSPKVSGWSVVFWLLMALCVTASVLLILKWRRMRDKKATYKTKVKAFFSRYNGCQAHSGVQMDGLMNRLLLP
ncbi:butyrophilin-like protein 2 isoform X2 [Polypterus senegalus]|uniref:butyrophilin-like protein 2 isoform X2 n=1 Tax=Polypterus senegalus TaxID=55291 RepID=UPI001965F0D8|nr:butyrophilin-like protein 2 isoform X2 [Polypterus senegalus]